MSDEETDGDTCPPSELKSYCHSKCSNLFSKKLSDKGYVLSISGLPKNESNVAIGRSDGIAQVYNLPVDKLVLSEELETDSNIIGVKVCPENENIFYVGTNDCEIKVWDTRKNGVANVFKDTTKEEGNATKILNCFDVSSNNKLISGGTDLFACDAYILFWDIRKCNLMGSYWESHTDDVTQVLFNPNNMDQMISGSTDGLINIYDLTQSSEDDALVDCLNTVSSVEKLIWYNNDKTDGICCVTHTNDLQFWKLDQAAPHTTFNRKDLTDSMKRQTESYIYIADLYANPKNNRLNILCGSSYENSKCLRGLRFVKNRLKLADNFKMNKQIVRCCWYNHNTNILLTGGEEGILDLWSFAEYS